MSTSVDEPKKDEDLEIRPAPDPSEGEKKSRAVEPPAPWYKALLLMTPLLELDLRALALFRVLFGLLCVGDLISRVPYIELMYASTGWLPNKDVFASWANGQPHPFSFLHMLNSPEAIFLFFVFSWVSLAFFIVGYKTKLAQVLSMLCMLSLHNRNELFQNGGDVAHNLWWMWTIVLPLGRRWSVDALIESWRRADPDDHALNHPPEPGLSPYLSLASLGILLNLSVCYFFNAIHKTGHTWMSGDAIAYTLEQDRIAFMLGDWVRSTLPNWALKGMSWGTLVLEGGAFVLLLSPWRVTTARRLILLGLTGLHLGIAWTVQIGFFSYWMISIYLVLLRREDMDALARLFRPRASELVMFYDSDCGVCHATARLGARLDGYRALEWVGRGDPERRPSALTEDAFLTLREDTLIAWDPISDQYWTHHLAVAQAAKRVTLLAPLGWLLTLTGPLGRWGYTTFASRRHQVSAWLGYGLCGLTPLAKGGSGLSAPSGPARLWSRLCRAGGELYIILAIIVMFYATIYHNRAFKVWKSKPAPPTWVRAWIHYGQMRQSWRLFSPDAPVDDGWMVLVAKLSDGREIDVRTGRKPDFRQAHYTRRTWNMYEARVDFKLLTRKHLWEPFLEWMKRPTQRFRLSPKDRIIELTYYWVGDRTSPPRSGGVDQPKSKPTKTLYHWSLKEERETARASAKRKSSSRASKPKKGARSQAGSGLNSTQRIKAIQSALKKQPRLITPPVKAPSSSSSP